MGRVPDGVGSPYTADTCGGAITHAGDSSPSNLEISGFRFGAVPSGKMGVQLQRLFGNICNVLSISRLSGELRGWVERGPIPDIRCDGCRMESALDVDARGGGLRTMVRSRTYGVFEV